MDGGAGKSGLLVQDHVEEVCVVDLEFVIIIHLMVLKRIARIKTLKRKYVLRGIAQLMEGGKIFPCLKKNYNFFTEKLF